MRKKPADTIQRVYREVRWNVVISQDFEEAAISNPGRNGRILTVRRVKGRAARSRYSRKGPTHQVYR